MYNITITVINYMELNELKYNYYGFCFGNAKGMWIKLLVEQVGDESRNPLSSSEIEIEYGILPLLSNTEFLSALEFLKTETKLIDIWQM